MKAKMMMFFCVIAVVGVLVAGQSDLFAQPGAKGNAALKGVPPKVTEATLTGENFCVGCSLKKKLGAKAQCSIYGHKHALNVTGAVGTDGKEIPWLKGWVLQYLDNDAGQPFVKDHHGETLNLSGKVYSEARVFEVSGEGAKSGEAASMPSTKKKPDHPTSEHPSGDHPK